MTDVYRKLLAGVIGALDGNLADEDGGAVGVYDHVPQNAVPVHVRIESSVDVNDDTKAQYGIVHTVEVGVYSAHRGTQQVRYVMDQIRTLLNGGTVTMAGFQVGDPRWTFSTAFLAPDEAVGTMRFDIRTFPE